MGDSASPSPVVHHRRLRAELRAARLKARLTQEQVAAAEDWSLSKVIRIEAGSVGISTSDLKALLSLYGIDDPHRADGLVALAKAAKKRGWESEYREFLTNENQRELLQLIGYEGAATFVRNFETLLVPGLLQTEEYARAVIREFAERPSGERADKDNEDGESADEDSADKDRATREQAEKERADKERADKLVEIRMERQKHLLELPEPPHLFFILDEAVIRRLVGGKAAMRRQISRLIELAERPRVTIEVVPFSAGAHPGLRGPFVVLEFPDAADDDVLYLENTGGDLIRREESAQVLPYRETFEQLRSLSLGPKETIDYLVKVADEMG